MCLTRLTLASGAADSLGSLCPTWRSFLVYDHRVKMDVMLLSLHESPVALLQECKDHVTLRDRVCSHGNHGHYSWDMEMGRSRKSCPPISESLCHPIVIKTPMSPSPLLSSLHNSLSLTHCTDQQPVPLHISPLLSCCVHHLILR